MSDNKKVTRAEVEAAVKSILTNSVYSAMKASGTPWIMLLHYAALRAFIYQTWPISAQVLRQGLLQLEKDGYIQ